VNSLLNLTAQRVTTPDAHRRYRIALPGLANPESQLGVPLMVRGDLVGVLCVESEVPYRFHEEDKASIELLGSFLAIAIQNMQIQEASEAQIPDGGSPTEARTALNARTPEPRNLGTSEPRNPGTPEPGNPGTSQACRREVIYYSADECILVDGEYLIRSFPAKILWKV
jgi:GAF domain